MRNNYVWQGPEVGRIYCCHLLTHVGVVGERSGLGSNPLLVVGSVLTVCCVRLSLRGVLDVGVIKKVLNSDQELLDGNCWPPILVLVQQAETHCARWVHIGVKQRRAELDLWRSRGEVLLEDHVAFVKASLPRSPFLSRNSKLPLHQVEGAVRVLHGAGDEAERVVLAPLFSLLG